MISLDRASYQVQPRYAEYAGLSTDVKPVESIDNGDEFQEIDTGFVYKFDETNSEWVKQPTGGSLTGTLSMSNQNIINLADPNNSQDAVTKNYLENYINSRINEALTAYRIRDLFGVQPRKEQTITLPDKRENVAIVYYSVDPEGNANISNSQAITVQAGQSVDTRDNFTVKFSDDMVTITFINNDETNSILGQYYGYNNQ